MKIKRKNGSYILKRKIDFNNLPDYDENIISKAKVLLKKMVESDVTNNFSLLYSIFSLAEKENISLADSLSRNEHKLYNFACIKKCEDLKLKLEDLGMKTYYISCKTNGLSTKSGNKYIKEAHVFLLYPCLKNNNVYFIIFDPGFYMNKPIMFFDKMNSDEIEYYGGMCKTLYVKDKKYPYKTISNRMARTNYEMQIKDVSFPFNPYYETINVDDFYKEIVKVFISYQSRLYPGKIKDRAYIKLNVIDKSFEYSDMSNYDGVFSLDDIKVMGEKKFRKIINPVTKKLNIDTDEIVQTIFYIIEKYDEFKKNIFMDEVIKEYQELK